ncbi:MAG: DRTGG domain-containing protein [bacterium]|jgi:predicted transcriptional regulator|nr:DRTGG domain-containing protein [candidate division KSB1 bacterium]MDH7561119.1 DRTGG domain-containing protein [bacterium]
MTTKDLMEKLDLRAMSTFAHREVKGVIISDMVSDVMASARQGDLWLTVQTHKSIVPAANLVDVAAVVVTSGKEVPQETIDLASKFGIPILWTSMSTFALAGRLHDLGLRSL